MKLSLLTIKIKGEFYYFGGFDNDTVTNGSGIDYDHSSSMSILCFISEDGE